jgi:hypothetical protein
MIGATWNVLSGMGTLLDLMPAGDPLHAGFRARLSRSRARHVSDYEAVLSDLRRSMLNQWGMIAPDERARLRETIRARWGIESERGLDPCPANTHQLFLPFDEDGR